MDCKKLYNNAVRINIPEDLRASKSLDYIIQKEKELLDLEKRTGIEYVIGVWGNPLPRGHVIAYCLHPKKEADDIIKSQKENKESLMFGSWYFDKEWFKRKKERLQNYDWDPITGQVILKKVA
ncbi:hypothetical protein J4468_04270 [Candidatus Woesearchaeota archaeon]|nr:hypothetical protein [Candidatus Woesearchaeota archaeon]